VPRPGSATHRHCVPVRLGRDGRSVQLGRASAPTIPQPVQTMRGPKGRHGHVFGLASTESTALWWQSQHDNRERADAVGAHVCRGSWEARGRASGASAPLRQCLPANVRDLQPNQLPSLVRALGLREPAHGQVGNDFGGDSACAHDRLGAAVWKAGQQLKCPTMVACRHALGSPLRLHPPPHRWGGGFFGIERMSKRTILDGRACGIWGVMAISISA
jgi:hypothetical protein